MRLILTVTSVWNNVETGDIYKQINVIVLMIIFEIIKKFSKATKMLLSHAG